MERQSQELVCRETMAHAVCIALPDPSHIKALLKLAKLLYQNGFHIPFVNTAFFHRRFINSQAFQSFRSFPGFRFESIPDGFPESADIPNLVAFCRSVTDGLMAPRLKELLQRINDVDETPPVSCLVSDSLVTFTLDVAKELRLPQFMFFTISASTLMSVKQFGALRDRGLAASQDEGCLTDEYLASTVIDWIPSMENIRLRDFPSFVRTSDPNDFMFNFLMRAVDRAVEASAVIVHTFQELEPQVLEALSSIYPKIYTITPLELLLEQATKDCESSVSYSFLEEEDECLKWLDKQKPKSVVYVNFGNVATIKASQLVELAMGLVNSSSLFLWVMRPDLVEGEETNLSDEFLEKIEEGKGFVAKWCDQEKVLKHTAVGAFVTHSGWNSTMESLTEGVPMLCSPCFVDQHTNSWLACAHLGAGMEMELNAKRDEIERMVKEVMEGEKGKVMKDKASHWSVLAHEATAYPNGSSFADFHALAKELSTKTSIAMIKTVN